MERDLERAQELWKSIGANFDQQFQRSRDLSQRINTEARKRREENAVWMKLNCLTPVHDAMTGGYAKGFDRNASYQFMRVDWDAPKVFELTDCLLETNIVGLYYRPRSKGMGRWA